MERLAFVGDSAINLCIVLYQVLGGNIGKREEELSTEKTLIIKESNIEAKCKKSGLQNILLQVFETDSTNDSKKSLQEQTDSISGSKNSYKDIKEKNNSVSQIQRIVGFIVLTFGIDAVYMFLTLIEIIPHSPIIKKS
jgi:hypothetical protein